MAEAKKKSMIITLSGKRPIHEVAKELKDEGFEVDQILETTNIVTGSAHPNKKNRLQKIHGVADVSDDHVVDIGPPGAIS